MSPASARKLAAETHMRMTIKERLENARIRAELEELGDGDLATDMAAFEQHIAGTLKRLFNVEVEIVHSGETPTNTH